MLSLLSLASLFAVFVVLLPSSFVSVVVCCRRRYLASSFVFAVVRCCLCLLSPSCSAVVVCCLLCLLPLPFVVVVVCYRSRFPAVYYLPSPVPNWFVAGTAQPAYVVFGFAETLKYTSDTCGSLVLVPSGCVRGLIKGQWFFFCRETLNRFPVGITLY